MLPVITKSNCNESLLTVWSDTWPTTLITTYDDLDGKNTFHGMDIVPTVAHGLKVTLESNHRREITAGEIKTAK